MVLEGKQPPGRVPHFELVFYLTMEAFGRIHPQHRLYVQWDQMSQSERQLHVDDIADLYVQTARRYEHSAIFFHEPCSFKSGDDIMRMLDKIRELSGMDFFLMMHGDYTGSFTSGQHTRKFFSFIARHTKRERLNWQRRNIGDRP